MTPITKENVSKLYLATFARPLDTKGLDYWINIDGEGSNITTIEELSENFALQDEYLKKYPPTTTDSEFINSIYQNLFQRDAEPLGLEYWVTNLESGVMSRDKAILSIVNGAKDTADGNDLSLITNRSDAALYLAEHETLSPVMATSTAIVDAITSITDDSSTVALSLQKAHTVINQDNSNIDNDMGELSDASTFGVSALESGDKWTPQSEIVTYSFNKNIPSDYYDYYDDFNNRVLVQGWNPLNTEQQNTVRTIMDDINSLLGITLKEVSSGGDIEFNILDMDSDTSGFSFMPGYEYDFYGDVFLSSDFNNYPEENSLEIGGWGNSTIVHEIGHALGLKHPFEGGNTLPEALDNIKHSVMSYTLTDTYVPSLSFDASQINMEYKILNPNLYSLYDVAALQALYGVNETTNLGDTTYTTQFTDYELKTIWDVGGVDTIDLSTTTGTTTIDLSAGTLNSVDQHSLSSIITMYQDMAIEENHPQYNSWIADQITQLYTSDNLYTGTDNFAIATGVIIENITTGLGSDVVKDNEVDNIIKTLAGDDKIYVGDGGSDYVDGGLGSDTLYMDITYSQIQNILVDENVYTIYADNYDVSFTNIETIHFYNGVEYTTDSLI
jgi:hypothetical protein